MRAMQWLRSLLFTIFLFVWTGCYAVFFVIAASLSPFRGRAALARVWGKVLLAVLRVTCRLDYRIEGRENLQIGRAHV